MSLRNVHCEIASLKLLFAQQTRKELDQISHLDLCHERIPEFPEFHIWAMFGTLQSLVLAQCALASFPAATIVRGVPGLTKLDLSGNCFTSVKDFVPLGRLQHLSEFDFRENPIPFIDLRVPLIRDLLFPVSKAQIKLVKYLMGEYISPTAKLRTPQSTKAPRGHKGVREFLHFKRKPGKVPRSGPFPMLTLLNDQEITEDELVSAKPYSDKDLVARGSPSPLRESGEMRVMSRLKNRVSVHPCVLRKDRVRSVPRFVKIPEFFGEATLQEETIKTPTLTLDPLDRHRIHRANHMELDFGARKVRKRSVLKLKRNMEDSRQEPPDSKPPSVAGEEDTERESDRAEELLP